MGSRSELTIEVFDGDGKRVQKSVTKFRWLKKAHKKGKCHFDCVYCQEEADQYKRDNNWPTAKA